MIEICYGMTDKDGLYSKFAGTSMVSIFENTHESVTIHLLHDSTLNEDNRRKFLELVENYHQSIKFYDLSSMNLTDRIRKIFKHTDKLDRWTNAAMYRLLTPEILPLKKIIYLDCDILVNLDINELWSVDLKNYPLAAIPESSIFPYEIPKQIFDIIDTNNTSPKFLIENGIVNRQDYFNSGVLMMNLPLLTNLFDRSLQFLQNYPESIYLDQDPLNFLFSTNYLKLPAKFDVFTRQLRKFHYYMKLMPPDKLEPWIYHCSGMDVSLNYRDPISKKFLEYFIKTPWALDSFQHLFNYAIDFNDKSKLNFQTVINTSERIFLSSANLFEFITEIFQPTPKDLLTDKISDVVNNPNKICLYLFEDESTIKQVREILSEHENLFDAREFLTTDQGIRNSSLPFLKIM